MTADTVTSGTALAESVHWTIDQQAGATTVTFFGVMDDRTTFVGLEQLQGDVVFDLASISRLSSAGVGAWIRFVGGLSQVTRLTFRRCSPAVVAQLNMVRSFRGKAEVESFYAPYVCEAAGTTEDYLLVAAELKDPLHPPVFWRDGEAFELDDLPSRYFAFLLVGHEPR